MATVTIDLTAAQAQRIGAAFGKWQGLVDGNGAPRSATVAEVRSFLVDRLREVVITQERRELQLPAWDLT